MSVIDLDIAARSRDFGNGLAVRRVLPFGQRRMVGPFIFVDHMGPARREPGGGFDVAPHPHINLATVTYLFDGEMLHRDSLGSEQPIRAGAVNWMTAGRGIVHSERSTAAARKSGPLLHGMQLWVALPTEHEEDEPSFQHHAADTIPQVERPGVRLRVLAGSAFGVTAPVKALSPLFYAEARLDRGAALELPGDHVERAAYIVEGAVSIGGEVRREGTMAVLHEGAAARMVAADGARVLLLGGAPLAGERHIWWNFVSSSLERIERAKADWRERRFGLVPGDDREFVPLPEPKR